MGIKVVCASVIGKSNNPLYIRCFDNTEEPLKFHYIVHSALDVVEEKSTAKKGASLDLYLGMLYPTEDYRVYGYTTNSKIKFIIVVQEDGDSHDQAIKNFFRKFHVLYANTVANPFYTPDDLITSRKFNEELEKQVKTV
eukprot:TRINITY_DN6995_c0_g1_i2.p1 TRINITY_DN6995_c0_g1~~TRINITY_DN6995_c0_g1_i2.p1  ORF type:complete len:139 (+),score=35.94 TRINITY_DN6995_c0_g1_i2:31-447(+)